LAKRRLRKRDGGSYGRGYMTVWFENPGKVALVVALIGGFFAIIGGSLVLLGQLAATIIPIMYGPDDASDFSINLDPLSSRISVEPISLPQPTGVATKVNVTAEDFHPTIRPYKFKINLQALGLPKNTTALFNPPDIQPGDTSTMIILSDLKVTGNYPIIIQGNGSVPNIL